LNCQEDCLTCTNDELCESCPPGKHLSNYFRCEVFVPICLNSSYYFYPDTQTCKLTCQYPFNGSYVPDQGKICSLGLNEEEIEQVKQLSSVAESGSTSSAVTGAIMSIIDSANPSALAVASLVKLIQYVKFLDIKYPPKLYLMLKSQKNVAGGITFFPEMSESLKEEFPSREVPSQFAIYEIHSSFLVGFWKPFMSMVVVMGVIFLISVVERMTKSMKRVHNIITKVSLIIKWNFMLTMFCSSYGDLAFYTMIELSTAKLDSLSSILSFVTCIGTNLIAFYVIGLNIHINLEFKTALKLQQGLDRFVGLEKLKLKWQRFEVFFLQFKTFFFMQQLFTAVFIIRSYINNMVLVVLRHYPVSQTVIMSLSSSLMLIYLLFRSPMKKSIINAQQILCEVILLVVNFCIMVLSILDALKDEDPSKRILIGDIVLGVNLVMSYAMTGFLVLKFVFIAREHYLLRKAAKLQKANNLSKQNNTITDLPKSKNAVYNHERLRIRKIRKLRKPQERANGYTESESNLQINIYNSFNESNSSEKILFKL